jgi:glucose-6-phosphate isomerase
MKKTWFENYAKPKRFFLPESRTKSFYYLRVFMNYTKMQWLERFQKHYNELPRFGLAIDLIRINLDEAFSAAIEPRVQKAFFDLDALEKGVIANSDKNRMVGHYWLRNAALAHAQEIRLQIESTFAKIKYFGGKVHSGEINEAAGKCKNFLRIGIGRSALDPQFVPQALGNPLNDKLKPLCYANTAPDDMKRKLSKIDIDALAAGDSLMETATNLNIINRNSYAVLAMHLHGSGNDKLINNMLFLPYKSRLELFSKYLQRRTMESLSTQRDLIGFLKANLNSQFPLGEISKSVSPEVYIERFFDVLEHLAGNAYAKIKKKTAASASAAQCKTV